MGTTKTGVFTEDQNDLALIIKALAHPARIAIIQHLISLNSCVCGDIVEELDLAQSTISQHLKELKRVGLIKGTIEGTSVCYCIDDEKWSEVRNRLDNFFGSKIDTQSCC